MAKKVTVKFTGNKPVDNVVRANIPVNKLMPEGARKITFTHRHSATIDTGLEVDVASGYKLCFSLFPELVAKGMVATNVPGNLKQGTLFITLLNCGREIVDIKHDDPLAVVHIEQDIDFQWEE